MTPGGWNEWRRVKNLYREYISHQTVLPRHFFLLILVYSVWFYAYALHTPVFINVLIHTQIHIAEHSYGRLPLNLDIE